MKPLKKCTILEQIKNNLFEIVKIMVTCTHDCKKSKSKNKNNKGEGI